MSHCILPSDTSPGNNFEEFRKMLQEAVRRAEQELKKGLIGGRDACGNPTKNTSYGPYHGIYLPDAKSFFCGIIHDTPDFIIFSPEGNARNYRFNHNIAQVLRLDNYEAVNYIKGVVKPTKRNEFEYQVLFKASLKIRLLGRNGFYSLSDWDSQCDWLSAFITMARRDVELFKN